MSHVRYWRLFAVDRARGRPRPPEAEIQRHNFAEPEATGEDAWRAFVALFHESHATVRAAAADEQSDFSHFKGVIAHDHLGQIMLLRAMQGKAPVG